MRRVDLARHGLVVVAAAAFAAFGCGSAAGDKPVDGRGVRASVVRVVDGDTLVTSGPDAISQRVRVLGIDTPESVRPGTPLECGATQAAASLKSLAPAGAAVRLRTDPGSGDIRDSYGRLLAFISVGGSDLGLEQVRRGWARVYAYRGRKFAGRRRYEHAYARADQAGLGVHGRCASDFHRPG